MSRPPRSPRQGLGGNGGAPSSKRNYEQYERDMGEDGEVNETERTKRQRAGHGHEAEGIGPGTAGPSRLARDGPANQQAVPMLHELEGSVASGIELGSRVNDTVDGLYTITSSASLPRSATPVADSNDVPIPIPAPPSTRTADARPRSPTLFSEHSRGEGLAQMRFNAFLNAVNETPPSAPDSPDSLRALLRSHAPDPPIRLRHSDIPTGDGSLPLETRRESLSHVSQNEDDIRRRQYQAHVSAAREHLHSAMELLRAPTPPSNFSEGSLPPRLAENLRNSGLRNDVRRPQRRSTVLPSLSAFDSNADAGSSGRRGRSNGDGRPTFNPFGTRGRSPPAHLPSARAERPHVVRSWFSNPASSSASSRQAEPTDSSQNHHGVSGRSSPMPPSSDAELSPRRAERLQDLRERLEPFRSSERFNPRRHLVNRHSIDDSLDLPPLSLPSHRPHEANVPSLRDENASGGSGPRSSSFERRSQRSVPSTNAENPRQSPPSILWIGRTASAESIDRDHATERWDIPISDEESREIDLHEYRRRADQNSDLFMRSRDDAHSTHRTWPAFIGDPREPLVRTDSFSQLRQRRARLGQAEGSDRRQSPFQRFGASAPDGLEISRRLPEEDIYRTVPPVDPPSRPLAVGANYARPHSPFALETSLTPPLMALPTPPQHLARTRSPTPDIEQFTLPRFDDLDDQPETTPHRWLDIDSDDLRSRSTFRSSLDGRESRVFHRSPSPLASSWLRASQFPSLPRAHSTNPLDTNETAPSGSSSSVSGSSGTISGTFRRRTGERGIDSSVFHDGPFRATLARQQGERQSRTDSRRRVDLDGDDIPGGRAPPRPFREPIRRREIVPLSWELSGEDSVTPVSHPSLDNRDLRTDRPHRILSSSTPDDNEARSLQREHRDVHNILRRRLRVEASDIDDGLTGRDVGFTRAVDALRADGLSSHRQRQLVDQYQRERSAARATRGESPLRPLWEPIADADRPQPGPSHPRHIPRTRPPREFAPLSEYEMTPFPQPFVPPPPPRRRWRPSTLATGRTTEAGNLLREDLITQMRRERFGERQGEGGPLGPIGFLNFIRRGGRGIGDYVRDEDFDTSYENLLRIADLLGDVRPRATPEETMRNLPRGTFAEWSSEGCDQRCPICLEDYVPEDSLLKLPECSHWLHHTCLQEWLRNAHTCPVCRKDVQPRPPSRTRTPAAPPRRTPSPYPLHMLNDNNDEQDPPPDDLNNSSTNFDSSAGPRFG